MKKKSVVLLLVATLMFMITNILNIKADSGWDVSYDSSSSSYSSDYTSTSTTTGEPLSTTWAIVFVTITLLPIVFGIILIISTNLKAKKLGKQSDKEIEDKLREYQIDSISLKEELVDIYKDTQRAWMNFDYEGLRKLLTDELFNTYSNQLDSLKAKEERNVVEVLKVEDSNIAYFKEENNFISVNLNLTVVIRDYVVDSSDNILRGNTDMLEVKYSITYVKPLINKDNTCPSCGAKIEKTNKGKCEYCRSIIASPQDKFVMSKKTVISQRRL